MTDHEEREILIKELKRLINEASNYELRCAYILLLSMLFRLPVRVCQHPSGLFHFLSLCHTSVYRAHRVELVYQHGNVDFIGLAAVEARQLARSEHFSELKLGYYPAFCRLSDG